MKTKRFLLCLLLVAVIVSPLFSQTVKTYKAEKSYNSFIGLIRGNEQYSYYVNDKGEKVHHGAYSFSGSTKASSNLAELSGSLTITASFKNGELNGAYSSIGQYSGKTFSYARGWTSYTATIKITGVFAESKPNGTFTMTDEAYKASATMKGGKYFGSYMYDANVHIFRSIWC